MFIGKCYSHIIKNKKEDKEPKERTRSVSPSTPTEQPQTSKPEEKETTDEDDWKKKPERELVIKPTTPEPVSLCPGVGKQLPRNWGKQLFFLSLLSPLLAINFTLHCVSIIKEIQNQLILGEGLNKKRIYERNFLLQFQSVCTERPEGLLPMEVILGFDDKPGTVPGITFSS